jgi:mannose-6-phosphate isomerase-like protein (cupin superfamily)
MSILPPAHDDPRYTTRGVLHVPSGEGPTRWVAGDTYTLKADQENTNGSLALVEATVPPGGGPLPHVHYGNDEAFYLIFGELEFLDGDRTLHAGPGDFLFVPRGIRHRFVNKGLHPAKMLFLFTPAGIEGSILDAGEEARPGELSPPWHPETFILDREDMLARYNTEQLLDPRPARR